MKNLNDRQLASLTPEQRAFYDVMKSAATSEGMMTLGIVSNSEKVLVGSWDTGELDITDMNAFGTGEGTNKFSTFGYEVAEQQYKQSNSMAGYNTGHIIHGIGAEDKISGYSRSVRDSGTLDNLGTGTITIPYTRVGSGTIKVSLQVVNGNVINVTRTK